MGWIWKEHKDQVKFDRAYLPGFTPRSLRHHPSLLTTYFCIIVGMSWCAYMSARTLIYNPDSLMLRRDNHERYRDGKDYKLLNITGYRPKSNAPIYRREGDPPDSSYASPDY